MTMLFRPVIHLPITVPLLPQDSNAPKVWQWAGTIRPYRTDGPLAPVCFRYMSKEGCFRQRRVGDPPCGHDRKDCTDVCKVCRHLHPSPEDMPAYMTMSPCNEGESCKDEYCLYRHPKKAQRAYRFDYLACYHDGRIVAAYKGPSGTLFKQVRYRHYPLRENIQHESRYLADITRRLDYVIRRMQQLGEGRRLEEAGTPLSPANPATPTPHSTAPPPIHYPRVPNVMAQPFDLARHPPVLRGPIIAPHGGHCYPHAQVQMAASPPPPSPMFKTPGLPTSFVHGPFGHYTPIAPAPAIEHYYGGPGPVYSSPPVMCS